MLKLEQPTCNQVYAMITQDAFTIGKMVIKFVQSLDSTNKCNGMTFV